MSNFNTASPQTLQTGTRGEVLRKFALVALCSSLITVAAKVSVPVWPVPVTLQTFAVAVIAATAGRQVAVAAVTVYLIQGMTGLPVFASGGGPLHLFGPTGGFLIAYLPMAYIIARAVECGAAKRPVLLLGAMLAADATVMGLGFLWLLASAGAATWIDATDPVGSAWRAAVEPFLLWDALKMMLAACLIWTAQRARTRNS